MQCYWQNCCGLCFRSVHGGKCSHAHPTATKKYCKIAHFVYIYALWKNTQTQLTPCTSSIHSMTAVIVQNCKKTVIILWRACSARRSVTHTQILHRKSSREHGPQRALPTSSFAPSAHPFVSVVGPLQVWSHAPRTRTSGRTANENLLPVHSGRLKKNPRPVYNNNIVACKRRYSRAYSQSRSRAYR